MINERYRITERIGKGRSSVFLCKDMQQGEKDTAVKVLSHTADEIEKQGFLREFFMLKDLDHPSIVKVRNYGQIHEPGSAKEIAKGDLFITQEFYNGKDLTHLSEPGEELLTDLVMKICGVLFYLHQSRFVYYDLKPENILHNVNGYSADIKLIDFGLAKHGPAAVAENVSGSREYIAPELLKKEPHNHRVDLYSLGIILYNLIYGHFPFSADNELDIYKAHIEQEFDFPESSYSDKIISVVKKLLEKNPDDRFSSALEIMFFLKPAQVDSFTPYWVPARIFSSRTDAIRIIQKFLSHPEETDVLTINGSAGTGKSALLQEINRLVPESVYLNYDLTFTGRDFINDFLAQLLYNPSVYNVIDNDLKNRIRSLIKSGTDNFIEEVTSVISVISRSADFTLLFDNYNSADEYVREIFKNIIPILQVGKRKIVLSEDTDKDLYSSDIPNKRDVNLTPFTDVNLGEFLNNAFAPFFPSAQLKKAILLYADLLPGNIISFIRDLLVLKIIKYTAAGIIIDDSESTQMLLQTSQDNIYRLRLYELSATERHILNYIAAVNTPLTEDLLERIVDSSVINLKGVLQRLRLLNIIQPVNQFSTIAITSEGLKQYIYKHLEDRKNFHQFLAAALLVLEYNRVETARQFELAEQYDNSYEILYEEINKAIRDSAFNYARALLDRVLRFQLNSIRIIKAKRDLAEVLFNLSRFADALDIIEELFAIIDDTADEDLMILKAGCLTGNGDYAEAKDLLLLLSDTVSSTDNRRKLQVELANAEFELANYKECADICRQIIKDPYSSVAEQGKCCNLLGLINIFTENNITGALDYFTQAEGLYASGGKAFRVAQLQMNIGNIYNMKGAPDKAEEYWNLSFKTISSIGNLEFEAKLLLNFGIYHFDHLRMEESVENYNKARNIFISLGNLAGQGLVLYNLGEIYFVTCEYQKSLENLNSSAQIFGRLKNLNEELESLFMLAKVYFVAGDSSQVSFITDIIGSRIEKEEVAVKHKTNYLFLTVLVNIYKASHHKSLESFKKILESYKELDDKYNYSWCSFLFIDLLISNKIYQHAHAHLNDETLLKYCRETPVLEAERNYLYGMLARESNICERTVFDYLLEASEFLQQSSIHEVTWKVFFALGELYEERGVFSKAEENFIYARSVLEYISDNTTDKNLKFALINSPERSDAYARLIYKEEGSLNE